MSAPDRTAMLAALVAAVIRGLPAPTEIRFHDNGSVHLQLDRVPDVAAWSDGLVPAADYEYRYEPTEPYPYGYRIVGGSRMVLGAEVSVSATEDLPPATALAHSDEEAVLAFADGPPAVDEPVPAEEPVVETVGWFSDEPAPIPPEHTAEPPAPDAPAEPDEPVDERDVRIDAALGALADMLHADAAADGRS